MLLVFDIGGTNTRVALVKNGVLGEVLHMPTDRTSLGLARFLGTLQEVAGGQRIKAIAGGFPGQLKGEDGEVVVATNLPEWEGLKLLEGITQLFDCPVYIANDVELCGLAEAHFGAGLASGVMAYYTVSTGVNGVRIIDGAVDPTISRYEMGYQVIDHAGGNKPLSLESLAGGLALERRLGVPPHDVRDDAVWAGIERRMAVGLYNTMLYWDPSVIVLGGKMMKDLNIETIADELELMPKVHEAWPVLKPAKCGDEAGVRGAVVWLSQLGYK